MFGCDAEMVLSKKCIGLPIRVFSDIESNPKTRKRLRAPQNLEALTNSTRAIMRLVKSRTKRCGSPYSIPVYTAVKVKHGSDVVYYRADPVLVEFLTREEPTTRCDWGTFRWDIVEDGDEQDESEDSTEQDIPGKMLCFLMATPESKSFFGDDYQQGRLFAVIQSLSTEPEGYLSNCEETPRRQSDIQHPASKLIFKGKMEMDGQTIRTTLTPMDTLTGPAIVVQDFDPVFTKGSKTKIKSMLQPRDPGFEHMIIRGRRQWSDVFQAMCRKKYGNRTVRPPKYENVIVA